MPLITVVAETDTEEYSMEFDVNPREAPYFIELYRIVGDKRERVTDDYEVATRLVGGEPTMRRLEDTAYEIAADREYDAYEEAQLQKAEWERDD